MACLKCLIEELKDEKWYDSPENVLLKIAYEKKIIQNNTTSIKELNKEDRKNVEAMLYLYNLEDYGL